MSLAIALTKLGVPTVHWPRQMIDFCRHRGAVDITVACRFRELDLMFPKSLFIYTERPGPAWLKSVKHHYRELRGDLRLPDGEKQFAEEADIRIYGTPRPFKCDFMSAYERHHDSVLDYFKDRPDDLLRINISAGEGWAALSSFLGLPVIDIPFPHAHRRRRSEPPKSLVQGRLPGERR